MVKTAEGKYRVTIVGKTGYATRKSFHEGHNAYQYFQSCADSPHVMYAVLVDLTNDHVLKQYPDWVLHSRNVLARLSGNTDKATSELRQLVESIERKIK